MVDAIRTDIKKGELADGTQLPTVQSLSEELGIARGTIKRAYDQLAQLGLVELIQGRGTFVSYQPVSDSNRQDQALAAIDELLDQLQSMGLPMAEISSLLSRKLRDRSEILCNVKIAVVECNPENLLQLSDQLRKLEQVEVYSFLLSSLETYPYQLDDELDLIITTQEHARFLETIVPDRKKIARIALRLSPRSVAGIVKLKVDDTLGILASSQRFGSLLHDTCQLYTEHVTISEPKLLDEELNIDRFLHGKTAILVPDEFEKYASSDVTRRLQRFSRKGRLIRCSYEMDEGSFLYVQEKIGRLREKKTL